MAPSSILLVALRWSGASCHSRRHRAHWQRTPPTHAGRWSPSGPSNFLRPARHAQARWRGVLAAGWVLHCRLPSRRPWCPTPRCAVRLHLSLSTFDCIGLAVDITPVACTQPPVAHHYKHAHLARTPTMASKRGAPAAVADLFGGDSTDEDQDPRQQKRSRGTVPLPPAAPGGSPCLCSHARGCKSISNSPSCQFHSSPAPASQLPALPPRSWMRRSKRWPTSSLSTWPRTDARTRT